MGGATTVTLRAGVAGYEESHEHPGGACLQPRTVNAAFSCINHQEIQSPSSVVDQRDRKLEKEGSSPASLPDPNSRILRETGDGVGSSEMISWRKQFGLQKL